MEIVKDIEGRDALLIDEETILCFKEQEDEDDEEVIIDCPHCHKEIKIN